MNTDSPLTQDEQESSPHRKIIETLVQELMDTTCVLNRLTRFEYAIPAYNPLKLLDANPISNRSYWKNRNHSLTIATLGTVLSLTGDNQKELSDVFQQAIAIVGDSQASFIGGSSFTGNNGTDQWHEYQAVHYQLPLIEFREQHGSCSIHINLYATSERQWQSQINESIALLNQLSFPDVNHNIIDPQNQITSRHDSLTYSDWQSLVEQTLFEIRKNDLQKVVLAREVTLTMTNPVGIFELMEHWQDLTPNCFSFIIEQKDSFFAGCSPERLFCRRQNEISTESLAGTLPRGKDAETDFLLGQELLTDPKLSHEHELVSKFILDAITPLASSIQTPDVASLYQLDRIQHRYLPIKALLTSDIGDEQVMRRLHPTPAVGGMPRTDAMSYILQHEKINRGWYSGVVGIISAPYSEFTVAIRSALFHDNLIHCYSGVGLVEGSTPASEWQELESKLGSLFSVLEQDNVK